MVFVAAPGQDGRLDEELTKMADGLGDLPGLVALTWGANTNPTGLSRGYSHGCLGRFEDKAAFQRYWDHPAHVAFADALEDICTERFALDYVAGARRDDDRR